MKRWKRLRTSILLEHPRHTVKEDDILLPDGHESKYIYYLESDSAMVVCIKDDAMLIQTEYSYPPDTEMYQLPGGGMEKDEEPIQAALRELQEESGYTSDSGQYLGYYYRDNRRSSSKMHVILVENPQEAVKQGGDAEEYIESEWIPLNSLRKMIGREEIVNSSILTGLALYDN